MKKRIQLRKKTGKNREWKAVADYRRWKKSLKKKKELWQYLKQQNFTLYMRLRWGFLGQGVNLPGKGGRKVSIACYKISQKFYGFN